MNFRKIVSHICRNMIFLGMYVFEINSIVWEVLDGWLSEQGGLNTVEEEYLSLVRGLEGQFLAYNNGGGRPVRKERRHHKII
jgi:hypothetical protein